MKLKKIRARGAGTPTSAACCATVSVGGLTLQQDSWSQSGQPHYQQEGEHLEQQERSINTESGCVCVNNIMHAYNVHCTCPTFTPLVGSLTPPKHIHIRHGSGNGILRICMLH